MSLSPFAALLISLALAVAGPLAAMRYLRPILMQTIGRLCDDGQGSGPIAADFWTRAAYVLAISGTALLVLLWGDFDAIHPMQALRRGLLLVSGGVFASVAFIAFNVWKHVAALLAARPARLRPCPRPLCAGLKTGSPAHERPSRNSIRRIRRPAPCTAVRRQRLHWPPHRLRPAAGRRLASAGQALCRNEQKRAPRMRSARDMVNTIFYVQATGCQWHALPKDYPPCCASKCAPRGAGGPGSARPSSTFNRSRPS